MGHYSLAQSHSKLSSHTKYLEHDTPFLASPPAGSDIDAKKGAPHSRIFVVDDLQIIERMGRCFSCKLKLRFDAMLKSTLNMVSNRSFWFCAGSSVSILNLIINYIYRKTPGDMQSRRGSSVCK